MIQTLRASAPATNGLVKSPLIAATIALWMICGPALAGDALVEGFRSPPPAAQPRVWWHWMNGNVSEQGVKLDFEWMKRVGIGGVHNFTGGFETRFPGYEPPRAARPVNFLSPEWKDTLRYSVSLANELGLEFGMAASAGWSETGGPWVTPPEAMKKLVWSETFVRGGGGVSLHLPRPPDTTGLFQNIPLVEYGEHGLGVAKRPIFYADVATIAYRAPASERPRAENGATITASTGAIDGAQLSDGDLANAVSLPFGSGPHAWIQFSFREPQRVQALTAVIGPPLLGVDPLLETREKAWLEASDDGRTFRKVAELPRSGAPQQTLSFAPVVARVFRVVLERPEATQAERNGFATAPQSHRIAELRLHSSARVNRFEDKAGFSSRQIWVADDTLPVDGSDVVRKGDVIDLTHRMRSDGSVDWTPPAGDWVVLRFGYSLIGRVNGPAPPVGTGLEVDKLNATHVRRYIETYLDKVQSAIGSALVGRQGLQYLVMDSFEAGAQNWTDDLIEQFRKRRGYSLMPWLPVLTGRVVQSAENSDRFLWDFRKTLEELIAEAHYGEISKALHERGMARYGEGHEVRRAFLGDGMQAKRSADIPMGEMWSVRLPGEAYTQAAFDIDVRESASVSHIYGKNLAATEAFTVCEMDRAYGFAPADLKPLADRILAMGSNRFVIHASVHQPDLRLGPGIGLGPCGQWFTRKETWAAHAGTWVSYLTRSAYLLQQGRFVADIAYLYGEDTNASEQFRTRPVPVAGGYSYDLVEADALISEFSAADGKLTTRSGMAYRLLALDQSTRRVSVPVLRQIRNLVRSGAVLVGARPMETPSLADDKSEFDAIVTELWGGACEECAVGKGKVFRAHSISEALRLLQIPADVDLLDQPATALRFVHRSLGQDGDLYFVSNADARALTVTASFRITGKAPELWRADTATIAPLSYRIENGRTIVPLQLDPNDAVFVVFRQPTKVLSAVVQKPVTSTLGTLEGTWDVSFAPREGAATHARFDVLRSWTESPDADLKYFSGTVTYSKALVVRREWLKSRARLTLALGEVKNLAEVIVNGRPMGVLWKAPFELDITDALVPGDNRLEIKVTNLWPNRLIGDQRAGVQPIAYAAFNPFKADSPLLPSGLLGPVTLMRSVPH